jgi:hypothetical protein
LIHPPNLDIFTWPIQRLAIAECLSYDAPGMRVRNSVWSVVLHVLFSAIFTRSSIDSPWNQTYAPMDD